MCSNITNGDDDNDITATIIILFSFRLLSFYFSSVCVSHIVTLYIYLSFFKFCVCTFFTPSYLHTIRMLFHCCPTINKHTHTRMHAHTNHAYTCKSFVPIDTNRIEMTLDNAIKPIFFATNHITYRDVNMCEMMHKKTTNRKDHRKSWNQALITRTIHHRPLNIWSTWISFENEKKEKEIKSNQIIIKCVHPIGNECVSVSVRDRILLYLVSSSSSYSFLPFSLSHYATSSSFLFSSAILFIQSLFSYLNLNQ